MVFIFGTFIPFRLSELAPPFVRLLLIDYYSISNSTAYLDGLADSLKKVFQLWCQSGNSFKYMILNEHIFSWP